MRNAKANSRGGSAVSPEEMTAETRGFSLNYYLSRYGPGSEALVDDEAALIIDAVVDKISDRHRAHVGEPIEIMLLPAQRYPRNPASYLLFFGSVTMRGQQRSALAYLPSRPFWEMPSLIERGASLVQLHFEGLYRGHGDLTGSFIGHRDDLESLETKLESRPAR